MREASARSTPGRGRLDDIAHDERRTVAILIVTFWAIVKIMFLLRTGAFESWTSLRAAFSGAAGVNQVTVILFCAAVSYGVYALMDRLRSRSTAAQVVMAAASTIAFVLCLSAYGKAAIWLGGFGQDKDWATVIKETAISGWASFALYSAAVLALIKSNEARRRDRRASALEFAMREAQLRALRYQVDPHFLFNALNSVSAMVLDRQNDVAETMLLRLAAFFRRTLALDPTDDVPLAEEIDLQTQYLAIEQVRFEDRLRVDVDLPDELRFAMVPGFILQPLVENAIKHGAPGGPDRSLAVRIGARAVDDQLVVEVENRGGTGLPSGSPSTGTGLRNVRERLELRFGRHQSFSAEAIGADGFIVRLGIPLITTRASPSNEGATLRADRRSVHGAAVETQPRSAAVRQPS